MTGAGDARPAGRAGRPLSELGKRVGSAVVMAGLALAATWAGGWAFTLLWLAAGIVIFVEWIDMSRARRRTALLLVGCGGLVAGAVILRGGPDLARTALAAGCAAAGILLAGASGRDRLWALGGIAYAALAMAVPVLVRDEPALGAPAILWIFAVVWLTDIGGYFVGRALGGPKLAPAISPGKTWSGFAGGLVAGTLSGIAVVWIAGRFGHAIPVGWTTVVTASALASVAGQVGDLAESAMKRLFAVKDSGWLIPGHGGLMDRLDGFVAAAALLALVLAAGPLGRGGA